MSAGEWVGLLLALLVMLAGVAGSIVPALPGPPLVLAAALVHKLWFGAASASGTVLWVMTALMLLSLALDFAASLVGARKLGATWRGVLGATVGGVVGLFFGPLALILGPFVGAMLFELLGDAISRRPAGPAWGRCSVFWRAPSARWPAPSP